MRNYLLCEQGSLVVCCKGKGQGAKEDETNEKG